MKSKIYLTLFTILFTTFFSGVNTYHKNNSELYAVEVHKKANDFLPIESFVKITTYEVETERDLFYGSGVVIKKTKHGDNYILTNDHVCREDKLERFLKFGTTSALKITTLSGEEHEAKFIKSDPFKDMCIIYSSRSNLPDVPISKEESKMGDNIRIIGAPHGFHSPLFNSVPIILGTYNGKFTQNWLYGKRVVQYYTAHILPGNSGSGIFNEDNELVGLVHTYNPRMGFICYGATHKDIKEFIEPYSHLK